MVDQIKSLRTETTDKVPETLFPGQLAVNTNGIFAEAWIGDAAGVPRRVKVGTLQAIRVFTASGSYVPTPGTKAALILLTGGGGGASSAHAGPPSGGAGGLVITGGGNAGWTTEQFILAPVNAAIVIGAGGLGGAAGAANNGQGGGNSTWIDATNSFLAEGGLHGWTASDVRASFAASLGKGDALTTSSMNRGFGSGRLSIARSRKTYANLVLQPGMGGSSMWGPGGNPTALVTTTDAAARVDPVDATYPGAGGSGSASYVSANGATQSTRGGNGAAGQCVVFEYG